MRLHIGEELDTFLLESSIYISFMPIRFRLLFHRILFQMKLPQIHIYIRKIELFNIQNYEYINEALLIIANLILYISL